MDRLILLIILGIAVLANEMSFNIMDRYDYIIDRAQNFFNYDKRNDYILIINTTTQRMYLIKNQQLERMYTVSTGKVGEGNSITSKKTPLGYFRIAEKIGDDAPIGAIFVSRTNTGKISKIYKDKTDILEGFVLTRILQLDGLEEAYNKGGDVDTYSRGIFIHGTHEEGLLGEKFSNGCIRMSNEEIAKLYTIVPNNTIVYITQ